MTGPLLSAYDAVAEWWHHGDCHSPAMDLLRRMQLPPYTTGGIHMEGSRMEARSMRVGRGTLISVEGTPSLFVSEPGNN